MVVMKIGIGQHFQQGYLLDDWVLFQKNQKGIPVSISPNPSKASLGLVVNVTKIRMIQKIIKMAGTTGYPQAL